jgi:hypothetical protein
MAGIATVGGTTGGAWREIKSSLPGIRFFVNERLERLAELIVVDGENGAADVLHVWPNSYRLDADETKVFVRRVSKRQHRWPPGGTAPTAAAPRPQAADRTGAGHDERTHKATTPAVLR